MWLDTPAAFVILGCAYAGAALGRAVSSVIDGPPVRKVLMFGSVELALALWLILGNLPALLSPS